MSHTNNRWIAAGTLAGLLCLAPSAFTQKPDRAEVQFEAASKKELVDGDLKAAIEQYQKIVATNSGNHAVAAKALLRMAQCYEKQGAAQTQEARKAYERIVREYADQKDVVEQAQARLTAKGAEVETGVVARQVKAKIGDRQYGPAISRDGRYLALEFHGSILVHDLVTGEEHPIVTRKSGEERFNSAIISPDGRQVAYCRIAAAADPTAELYVIGADGSNPRLLAGGKDYGAVPRGWSPDGKQLLARFNWKEKKEPQTVLVSVADSSSRVLGNLNQPRFSPDGRSIVFVKRPAPDSKDSNIFLLSLDGGAEIALVENVGRARNPLWTPDGGRLLFISDRRGYDDLWSVRIVDGKPAGTPELVRMQMDSLLDVSRDGHYYYQTAALARDLYFIGVDPQTGKVSSPPRRITDRDVNDGAAWSPDGEFLAYYARRGPQGQKRLTAVIRSMKTGEERELPQNDRLLNVYSHKPQWFPDGRALFLYGWDGKLGRLDVQTGEYRPMLESLTIAPYNDAATITLFRSPVVLTPDGRSICYLVRDQEAHQTRILWRDIESGSEHEVCRVSCDGFGALEVAPDGSRVLYTAGSIQSNSAQQNSAAIMVVPASGGEPRQLFKYPRPGSLSWSKDGRWIFFLPQKINSPQTGPQRDIAFISADGGPVQTLGIDLHDLYFLDVHPDGKQLVFADEQWDSQLWALKNLFPAAKKPQ